MQRESMPYDLVIVGAGPAGLAAACRLKQINAELSVCVVEKGSEVGAHILSGAVLEPSALNELFPDWRELGAPVSVAVTGDELHWFSSANSSRPIPSVFQPKTLGNHGNYVISLGRLCRWLAEQAETLGVDVFPGFAASELLFNEDGSVKGILIGDMGVSADGTHKAGFAPGMELLAKYTLLAEGCRGHLGKEVIARYDLAQGQDPQHYGLGIKELWKVPAKQHQPGLVVHTAGWPLTESSSTGGGFVYHLEDGQVSVGLITDLSYSNPHLDPFLEFQRYKHHPTIAKHLHGGERIAYGARAITKGGAQSQPRMYFPGGLLLGDDAGTLNPAKIKGIHTAMKSGMVAAETVAKALQDEQPTPSLETFGVYYRQSWAWKELAAHKNFAPAQHRWGSLLGGAYAFVDINLFGGRLPWTLNDRVPDHARLLPADKAKPIAYPKPDNLLSFDRLSSVYLSNTNHEEDQPSHLRLGSASIPIEKNLPVFDEPAQRYCPAQVYEIVEAADGQKKLQINAQNCVHCKTCDIKDPAQNITWVTPEGGGGPNYTEM